jgi:hypothetical protein
MQLSHGRQRAGGKQDGSNEERQSKALAKGYEEHPQGAVPRQNTEIGKMHE